MEIDHSEEDQNNQIKAVRLRTIVPEDMADFLESIGLFTVRDVSNKTKWDLLKHRGFKLQYLDELRGALIRLGFHPAKNGLLSEVKYFNDVRLLLQKSGYTGTSELFFREMFFSLGLDITIAKKTYNF